MEFFFVTSKALFCSAIHFAEACGKSVTVGTMKCDDTEELGEQILPVNCVNRKICVCVKQCRRRSVPKPTYEMLAPFPGKPKGMHRRTFQRLRARAEAAHWSQPSSSA
jgi:hypothetical protein